MYEYFNTSQNNGFRMYNDLHRSEKVQKQKILISSVLALANYSMHEKIIMHIILRLIEKWSF